MFDIWYSSSISTQPLRGVQFKCDRYTDHVNTLGKKGMRIGYIHISKSTICLLILPHCKCQNRVVDVNLSLELKLNEKEFIIDQRSDGSMHIELTSRTPTPSGVEAQPLQVMNHPLQHAS